jgi:hypothetical protein
LLPSDGLVWNEERQEFSSGGDKGIVVRLEADHVEIRLPTVIWEGPHTPSLSSNAWTSIPWEDVSEDTLLTLFAEGRAARLSLFRRCQFCGRDVPPEHRIDEETCHGCAERHQGVAF